MESDKIKLIPKPHLKLRRIGSRHMIVEASDSCVNLTNVYSLNGIAARLWEAVCKDGCRTPGNWRRSCARSTMSGTAAPCATWSAR